MGMKSSKYGRYKNVLLQSIAEVSGFQANNFVRSRDVQAHIHQDNKHPDRVKAVQAFYRLRISKEPLVVSGGHGEWSLTEKGVREVLKVSKAVSSPPLESALKSTPPTPPVVHSSVALNHPVYEAVMRDLDTGRALLRKKNEIHASRVAHLEMLHKQQTHHEQSVLTGDARIEKIRQNKEIAKVSAAIRTLDLEIHKTETDISRMEIQAAATEAQIESMGGDEYGPDKDKDGDDADDDPDISARRRRARRRAKGNVTNKWLTEHLTPEKGETESKLYKVLKSSVARKLPLSAASGRVEDHVQQFLAHLIKRDALAKYLTAGRKIYYSNLCSFASMSGANDIRKEGREPVCRALYGSTTETERKTGTLWFGSKVDTDVAKKLILQSFDSEEESSGSLTLFGRDVVIQDNETSQDVYLEQESFEKTWDQVRSVFSCVKPKAAERYVRIIGMTMKGHTIKEIATMENVTKNRASAILQQARRVLRASGGREAFAC